MRDAYPPVFGTKERALLVEAMLLFNRLDPSEVNEDVNDWRIFAKERIEEIDREVK